MPAVGPDNADLDVAFEALLANNHHAGMAACTIRGGEVTWCRGYGDANRELGTAVDATTPFLMASISKLFTATALMQLWESGAFELEDDVADTTDFPVAHPTSSTPVTYAMLLAHASSIVDVWGTLGQWYQYGNMDPSISLYDAVAGYLDPQGIYYSTDNWSSAAPGTQYTYSNVGSAFAGLLVQLLSGEDFAARSRSQIFEPLNLQDTAWRLSELDLDTVAMPYDYGGGTYTPLEHYTFADYPNGGLRASACDMARFLSSQAAGGAPLLDAATVELMQTPTYPDLNGTQGLGWYQENIGPGTWMGHSGGEAGVFTEAYYRLDDGVGFVLLTNTRGDDVGAVYAVEDQLIAWGETL